MARHTFGQPVSEDDVLVIQGIEYPMMPMGMRAMRRLLNLRKQVDPNRSEDDPITEEELDMSLDIVIEAVRPTHRDQLREHIDNSVGPELLAQIAMAVMRSFADVDPTQPGSSSDGSTPTGSDSAGGAPATASTPAS